MKVIPEDRTNQWMDAWTNYCIKKLTGVIPDMEIKKMAKMPTASKLKRMNDVIILSDWQRLVKDWAHFCGWKIQHSSMLGDGTPGIPDLILVKKRVIFVQLKSERGQLTAAQRLWRDKLLAAGACWYLWRPSDWEAMLTLLGIDLLRERKRRPAIALTTFYQGGMQ